MSVKTKVHQSVWLERINQSLYFRVPWRRRRQIIQELKANLAAASAEVGPEEALKQFGPAKELVNSYLDSDRGRFDLAVAITAGLGVWLLWSTVGALVFVIAWDTRDAISKSAELTHTYFGIWEVHLSPDGVPGGESSVTMNSSLVLFTSVIAFLIGGRIWRLFQRRTAQ